MKCVILAALLAVAVATPVPESHETPSYGYAPPPVPVKILKDERTQGPDGKYTLDVEAENGIVLSESGSPDGPEGAIVTAGQYSYTAPEGTPVVVKFVANENGFQPESDLLPVAPAFPHPIPQFVLDQIAKAAEEDAAKAQYGTPAPPPTYAR
ncbi:hypothetical protein O3P69_020615 [Scylla paramamosain]|uniref:Uncharacterized protein n=1 Tax=Scylla paramamosain TaxID=85552 RepID=A0AAW0TML3_SCYPA